MPFIDQGKIEGKCRTGFGNVRKKIRRANANNDHGLSDAIEREQNDNDERKRHRAAMAAYEKLGGQEKEHAKEMEQVRWKFYWEQRRPSDPSIIPIEQQEASTMPNLPPAPTLSANMKGKQRATRPNSVESSPNRQQIQPRITASRPDLPQISSTSVSGVSGPSRTSHVSSTSSPPSTGPVNQHTGNVPLEEKSRRNFWDTFWRGHKQKDDTGIRLQTRAGPVAKAGNTLPTAKPRDAGLVSELSGDGRFRFELPGDARPDFELG